MMNYRLAVNEFLPMPAPDIFNTREFFTLHRTGNSYFFQLVAETGKAVAVAHFSETAPGQFLSPARGTFGGFRFLEKLGFEETQFFVDAVDDYLLSAGAKKIEITMPAGIYNQELSDLVLLALHSRAYSIHQAAINHLLVIDEDDLLEKVDRANRKRINKCVREGYTTRKLVPDDYVAAYEVIVRNRRHRNYSLSMTFPQLQEMIDLFPERVHFFGAFQGDVLAAAGICLLVNEQVFYVFYWGEEPGQETFSPVTVLARAIYDYSKRHGFGLLDLGTSMLGALPNPGLSRFKRGLGAVESLKLSYRKEAASGGE